MTGCVCRVGFYAVRYVIMHFRKMSVDLSCVWELDPLYELVSLYRTIPKRYFWMFWIFGLSIYLTVQDDVSRSVCVIHGPSVLTLATCLFS